MDTKVELGQSPDAELSRGFDLDRAVEEARREPDSGGGDTLRVSEEVVFEIARRALARVTSVMPGSSGTSVLGLGRKNPDGVKITIAEEERRTRISVDAYVLVRYGLRIPDVAWDLQEFLKNSLEDAVGYDVKAVNVYVQGVFFGEPAAKEKDGAPDAEAKPAGE